MNALPLRTHACQRTWEPCCLGSEGFPQGRTAGLLDISENTLREYFREFLDGGIERLKEIRWTGPTRALSPFGPTIKDDFEAPPPATLEEAQQRIEQRTGIRRGRTQVHAFLKFLGFSWRKVAALPAKADVAVQEDFKKTSWSPVCRKLKKENGASSLSRQPTSSTAAFWDTWGR